MVRVYIDGIFDLFHRGHLESILKCKEFGDEIIVGVVSDSDASSYKRKPVYNESDRVEIIKCINIVDEVISPCPLVITEDFILRNRIDIIVHGFKDQNDFDLQKEFFKIPIEMGIFRRIQYYDKISTTEIISKIRNMS